MHICNLRIAILIYLFVSAITEMCPTIAFSATAGIFRGKELPVNPGRVHFILDRTSKKVDDKKNVAYNSHDLDVIVIT